MQWNWKQIRWKETFKVLILLVQNEIDNITRSYCRETSCKPARFIHCCNFTRTRSPCSYYKIVVVCVRVCMHKYMRGVLLYYLSNCIGIQHTDETKNNLTWELATTLITWFAIEIIRHKLSSLCIRSVGKWCPVETQCLHVFPVWEQPTLKPQFSVNHLHPTLSR